MEKNMDNIYKMRLRRTGKRGNKVRSRNTRKRQSRRKFRGGSYFNYEEVNELYRNEPNEEAAKLNSYREDTAVLKERERESRFPNFNEFYKRMLKDEFIIVKQYLSQTKTAIMMDREERNQKGQYIENREGQYIDQYINNVENFLAYLEKYLNRVKSVT